MKRITRCTVAFALVAISAPTFAQPTEAENRAAAEAIFNEASALMTQKSFDAACPKLEEVVKLQPNGIGARITLADCYAAGGELASAHANYSQAASMAALAGQSDRSSSAQRQAASLAPRLSKLTIAVPADVAALRGLEITRDGAALTPNLFNVPIAVDGGSQTIVASAPGRKPWTLTLTIPTEGGALTVSVGPFPSDPRVSAEKGSLTSPDPNVDESSGTPSMPPVRIAGIVTGALGLAISAAGIGVGVSGLFKTNDAADAYSAAPTDSDAQLASDDYDAGRSQQTAGWAVACVGGAALVAGIIMAIAAPSGDPKITTNAGVALWLTPMDRGMGLAGEW